MKIATWNLERLDKNKNKAILEILQNLNADILILTETNSSISPGNNYTAISSQTLPELHDGVKYKIGENRSTIWTKYKTATIYKTFDNFTSICTDIETPNGWLTVYGTIIGVFGGIGERFKSDMKSQLEDFKTIFINKQICVAGDFNVFFSGYAYPNKEVREILTSAFTRFDSTNLTALIKDSANHIVLSNNIIRNKEIKIETWNLDKKLSDHFGVCVTIV